MISENEIQYGEEVEEMDDWEGVMVPYQWIGKVGHVIFGIERLLG